jgi:hypothetical protein
LKHITETATQCTVAPSGSGGSAAARRVAKASSFALGFSLAAGGGALESDESTGVAGMEGSADGPNGSGAAFASLFVCRPLTERSCGASRAPSRHLDHVGRVTIV